MLLGITGGSGCGTSTVGHLLEAEGFCFIDADLVYRELLSEDEELKRALYNRFGASVFPDGSIDRKALASVVFSDPAALADLNAITHAVVIREIRRRIEAADTEYAAVEAIALIESGMAEACDAVISVLSDYETRLARIIARDGLSEEAARARLEAQKPDAFFIDNSDYVLTNNGSTEDLKASLAALLTALRNR